MDKKYTPFLIIGGVILAAYLWKKNKDKKAAASTSAAPTETDAANPEGKSEFGGMRRRFGNVSTRGGLGTVGTVARIKPWGGRVRDGRKLCFDEGLNNILIAEQHPLEV